MIKEDNPAGIRRCFYVRHRTDPTRGLAADRLLPWASGLLTFIIVVPVYLATVATDITWDHFGRDGAELATAAVTLGVPHPPGYPTYVILGKLASLVPLGRVIFRLNLLSSLSVAAAAASLAFLGAKAHSFRQDDPCQRESLLAHSRIIFAAVSTGTTFAFLPLVWSQALVAEVYGLNLLMLALFLLALMLPGMDPHPRLAGVLLGLAMTTHLTSLLMVPIAFVVLRRNHWHAFGAGLIIGVSPFLLLPILSTGASPVIWGEPTTLSGWLWLVSARLYHANVFGVDRVLLAERALSWASILARQFAWVGLPLLLVGLWHRGRSAPRLTVTLVATSLAYLGYALGYRTSDAIVFLLPALLLLSIPLADGLARAMPWAVALPLLLLMLNFGRVNLSQEGRVRALGQAVLEMAPHRAVLLTMGEHTTFTLWYMQHIESIRPDVTIVDRDLLMFDWYRRHLSDRHPDLQRLERDDVEGFRAANAVNRPVCSVELPRVEGALLKLNCDAVGASSTSAPASPTVINTGYRVE